MHIAIMIGRSGSVDFPGKNHKKILGRPMCEYPLIAASKSKFIKRIFVSTDCKIITKVSKIYKANFIDRPKKLATKKALGEDVFQYTYFEIKKLYKKNYIKTITLLFANAPTINSKMIDSGINKLIKYSNIDSAVSTSIYNMWSPLRARKLNSKGLLKPFVPFKTFGDPNTLNCDRDSQGDVYFADMSMSVVRPTCLENMTKGLLPQKWMGKNIAPIKSWGGFDVDYPWQLPLAEYWLKKNGYANKK